MDVISELEKLLREKGLRLEISSLMARCFIKTKNGLSQTIDMKVRYEKDSSAAIALGNLIGPFQFANGIEPINPHLSKKLAQVIESRLHIDIKYHGNIFEIEDHGYYPCQKPPVCCGGMSAKGETLSLAINNLLEEIERTQFMVAEQNRGSCSANRN